MIVGFTLDSDLDQQLAARPMSHQTALHLIMQAATALEDQAAGIIDSDLLSASPADELSASAKVQNLANILQNEVTPASDPLPDGVASDVETAVRDALGLKNTIAANADKYASSFFHMLGLPAPVAPPVPNWPNWLPSFSTILLFGAIALGGAYVLGSRRAA